jgi:hypothetical protein
MATKSESRDAVSLILATREYNLLQKYLGRLELMLGESIAVACFAEELISEQTLEKATLDSSAPFTRSYHLTKGILSAVAIDPNNLMKFISILEKEPSLDSITRDMKQDLESSQDITLLKQSHNQPTIHLVVKKAAYDEYSRTRGKLGELIYHVANAIEEANVDIENLKKFVTCKNILNEAVVHKIESANDIPEVFKVAHAKLCSPLNLTILVDIGDHFNLPQITAAVQKYEEEQQKFHLKLSSLEFIKKVRNEAEITGRDPTAEETTIEWKLRPALHNEHEKSPTLIEFENVLSDVFLDLARYIHVLDVNTRPGCTSVTLYAPKSVIGALIIIGRRKIPHLLDNGVISLIIGKEKIIDFFEEMIKSALQKMILRLNEIIKDNDDSKTDDKLVTTITTTTRSRQDLDNPTTSEMTQDDGDNEKDMIIKPTTKWRMLPILPGAVHIMIIASYGRITTCKSQVCPKVVPSELKTSPKWMNDEIDNIIKLLKHNPDKCYLKYTCRDVPGGECSKQYYLDLIQELLEDCHENKASIWYTGHGEKDTGNWCFKDGVITFHEIFDLYMKHFKGKRLYIVSDCSYSGNWIKMCVKKLDDLGIPSCGHHTRQHGILLDVFTSCGADEEATALTYVNEAVKYSPPDDGIIHTQLKKLSSGQTGQPGFFTRIFCGKPSNESCEVDETCTWEDKMFDNSRRVFLVRGKDKGREAWHFVLVDEDKIDAFHKKIASGTIDVADYGQVIRSGWGKDPSEEIIRKIDVRFCRYLKPK